MTRLDNASRFASQTLGSFVIGWVLILLCEVAQQGGLIGELLESSLRGLIWSAVVCISIYLAFRANLNRPALLSLVLFAIFSVAGFAVAATKDIPSLDNLPLVGRYGWMEHLFKKFLFAGWACSISYLFYDLIQSLGERTAQLAQAVTNLKHEISVRETTQANYQQIFEATSDGLAILDLNGTIIEANRSVCRMYDSSYNELIGQNAAGIIHPDHRRRCSDLVDSVREGSPYKCLTLAVGKEGGPFAVELSGSPIVYRGALHGLVVLRDITEEIRHREHIQQLRSQLAHVSRLSTMGEMATGIAHELNQPLTAIANYACAARQDLWYDNATSRARLDELLANLSEQAVRAGDVVHRIRSFVKSPQGSRETCDLHKLIDDVVELMHYYLQSNGIQLELHHSAPRLWVEIDEIQIQQVLLNLIRNAIEAMDGLNKAERRLEISTSRSHDERVAISVKDFGKGLTSEEQGKLFDAFYTTKEDGMGIGLAICQTIIESHEGRLWVERNLDRGVTFHFTVPLAQHGEADCDRSDPATSRLVLL